MRNLILVALCILAMAGCADRGGVNVVNGRTTMHMPFEAGTDWLCTQGAHGSYSHSGESTRYDLDFDTPNPPNEPALLFAPLAGTAYVHNDVSGFGEHVNIDLGDGTYVVLGHMSHVYVGDREFVQVGEAVGLAGCTGSCTGEHVHVGLHAGDASLPAGRGTSIPSNMFSRDAVALTADPRSTEDYVCGIPGGHRYESQLPLFMLGPGPTGGGDSDGIVELCWSAVGLAGARNGSLWVQKNGWQTVATAPGAFAQICGDVQAYSGSLLVVNGEYEASNTPGSPWWICAYVSQSTPQIYGSFHINGRPVASAIRDWGDGCDVGLMVP